MRKSLLAASLLAAGAVFAAPLQNEVLVQDWGTFEFPHMEPGTYTATAAPIQSGEQMGAPQVNETQVQPAGWGRLHIDYVPVNAPPEFPRELGWEYIYVINADASPPVVGKFASREEAVYYLGEDTVRHLEQATVTVNGQLVPVLGYQLSDSPLASAASSACNYLDCASVQQARAQEAAEQWASFVETVREVVEAIADWVESVIDAIVDFFESLFGG